MMADHGKQDVEFWYRGKVTRRRLVGHQPEAESHQITGGSLSFARLGEEGSDFWHHLFARLSRGPHGARQLQHRRVLTLAKISDQHDRSIRELERIVVHRPVIEVDLAEASHLVRQSPGRQEREPSVAFDFFFECKFCPRQQANGNARLTGITEAASDRIWKICRYKLVTDLGGSGRNGVKTIVTHRTAPFVHNPGGAPQHSDYSRTP